MATTIKQKRRQGDYFRYVASAVSIVEKAAPYWPTVTSVELSGDNSHLNIYVTFENNAELGLAALEKMKGLIRSEVAAQMNQRIVPQLNFKIDTSQIEGQKIDRILAELKKETKI